MARWRGTEGPIGQCSDTIVRTPIASQGVEAAVYERNCGATVDFATHVVVRGPADTEVVAIFQGRPKVKISWNGTELEVHHSPMPSEKVFRQQSTGAGIRVSYLAEGVTEIPTPPDRLDFSNLNYGATGRAAGMPAEVLLRSAGWAQEASGLTRPEWGHWWDASPYGDDPQGSSKIREGIDYYETKYGSPQ
jgi:hypothetical protein